MKVWWCLEHNVGDGDPTLFRPGQEVVACFVAKESYKYGRDCRMVPMRLIPEACMVATMNWGGGVHWIIPAKFFEED